MESPLGMFVSDDRESIRRETSSATRSISVGSSDLADDPRPELLMIRGWEGGGYAGRGWVDKRTEPLRIASTSPEEYVTELEDGASR